jgi:hypothetical protein
MAVLAALTRRLQCDRRHAGLSRRATLNNTHSKEHTVTIEAIEGWLHEYRRAWENRDPVQAAALFADDALYFETPFDAPARGRGGIREY